MQWYDNQDHLGPGSPLVVWIPETLTSSVSGYSLCPTKRRHGLTSESPSTSHGSVVTTIFDDRSNLKNDKRKRM